MLVEVRAKSLASAGGEEYARVESGPAVLGRCGSVEFANAWWWVQNQYQDARQWRALDWRAVEQVAEMRDVLRAGIPQNTLGCLMRCQMTTMQPALMTLLPMT